MKTIRITTLVVLFFMSFMTSYGQNYAGNNSVNPFEDQGSFLSYFENKVFVHNETGMTLGYGYISSYNTYGILLKTSRGGKAYFINCDIKLYGSFAIVTGTDPYDDSTHKITFYKDKLKYSDGSIFYLK